MDGIELLRQLAEAKKNKRGVFAQNVTVTGQYRYLAAQWLRERGVPIVATRARQNSMWYLLDESDSAQLKAQWRNRIVGDVYAELCRACQALSRLPSGKAAHDELQAYAVQVGSWLGRNPATVLDETRPKDRTPTTRAILDDVDRALRSGR
jgi:hypothetical protein